MKLLSPKESDWQQVLSSVGVPVDSTSRFTRVSSLTLLESSVVVVLLSATGIIADNWRFVGYVSSEIRTGLTVGGNPDCRFARPQKLYANQLQLFLLPAISDSYTLTIDINCVGDGVNLFAWEYTGLIE